MTAPYPIVEGKIPFNVGRERFETFFRLSGNIQSSKTPIVVLHGGPGTAHSYMVPLFDLAQRPDPPTVILYDQIGCGRSSRPVEQPASFWTIDLFIDELVNVLNHFSIATSFNIVGHSWGATLASEFVVRRQPIGLKRLVLSNCLASAKLRNASISSRRASLPSEVQKTLRKHEEAGTVQDPEYKAATRVFHEAFTCRSRPLPQEILDSFAQIDADAYLVKAIREGSAGLKDSWDITNRVHLIQTPTLVINGEFDYLMDNVCAPFVEGIPNARWVRFDDSGHMSHWDRRDDYMDVVLQFFDE